MISGVRLPLTASSPPRRFFTAEVAITVLGHRAFTATLPRNSPAMPSTHRLMPNFAIV